MRKFKTESKRLLDLMINSIYTNREIFLRELVSNASDALDKLYVAGLTDSNINRHELCIELACDEEARTITISDNGIGMDEAALEKNLGTIAHSGSLEFKQQQAEAAGEDAPEVDIIGQFGVGFYSSFMVADKVTVVSRAYGSEQAFKWESDGVEGYTIAPAQKAERGTTITLHLREDVPATDAQDGIDYTSFARGRSLQNLVRRYSNYVRYPIMMDVTNTVAKPKPEDAGEDYVPEYEQVTERTQLNSMVPIWTRKASEVEDEEYAEFYKSNFHDFNDPLRHISVHAEGNLEYDALLYIPQNAPAEFYSNDFSKGLALYSSNVMIMEECADLIPDHFGFVRGVVDTKDLSLNISREMLQKDRQLKAIERHLEKKIRAELIKMQRDEREAYEDFFKNFGASFKYAIYSSYGALKTQLADLLMFHSAKQACMVTFEEYAEAKVEGQESIFYATGDSVDKLLLAPTVKAVLDKGYDVLLCPEHVDEFALMVMGQACELSFKNVAMGDLGIESEEDLDAAATANETNADLFEAMLEGLGEEVSGIIASSRLVSAEDAASCVTAGGMVSLAMAKYFSQHGGAGDMPAAEYVLELNTHHPMFDQLCTAHEAHDAERVANYATVLFGQALLAEGINVEDPIAFNTAINALIA